MPVRSLNSVVFKWPDRESVLSAARSWAAQLSAARPEVKQVLCIGSYARGDWGVGSDVDLIVRVNDTPLSQVDRYKTYYPDGLPVPADLWVYTDQEWNALADVSPHLWRRLTDEMLSLT